MCPKFDLPTGHFSRPPARRTEKNLVVNPYHHFHRSHLRLPLLVDPAATRPSFLHQHLPRKREPRVEKKHDPNERIMPRATATAPPNPQFAFYTATAPEPKIRNSAIDPARKRRAMSPRGAWRQLQAASSAETTNGQALRNGGLDALRLNLDPVRGRRLGRERRQELRVSGAGHVTVGRHHRGATTRVDPSEQGCCE